MSTSSTPEPSFEEAMERLDEIVESMEGERLELDEMVGRYEEGVKLLVLCRQRVDHARLRIERINALLDNSGKAVLSPFEVAAEGGDESAAEAGAAGGIPKSGGRRGAKPVSASEGDEEIRLF